MESLDKVLHLLMMKDIPQGKTQAPTPMLFPISNCREEEDEEGAKILPVHFLSDIRLMAAQVLRYVIAMFFFWWGYYVVVTR